MTTLQALVVFALSSALPVLAVAENALRPIALKSEVTKVQPMTGIVLWDTSPHRGSETIQLEFSYLRYGRLVTPEGDWDWTIIRI